MLHLNKYVACKLIAELYLEDKEVWNWAATCHYVHGILKLYSIKKWIDIHRIPVNVSVWTVGEPINVNIRGADLVDNVPLPRSMKQLVVRGQRIGASGAITLGAAIKFTNSMTSLNLWNNNICDTGAIALSEAIKLSNRMTDLNLGSNNIGNIGAIALGETMKLNNRITKLNLSFNQISAGGPGHRALQNDKKLCHIEL